MLKQLILSQYLIGPGFVPQHLPQKETSRNKAHAYWVPSSPTPGVVRGKVPVPDSSCYFD